MYPAAFEYHAPTTVAEALDLLGRLEDAKLLAGGHSLVPMMRLRLARPGHLIDLRKVPGLAGIREEGSTLVIGAMTTQWEMESSPLLQARCPILAETASLVGDPQVRNKGTIGGSLAHADPAADQPAPVLAVEAELVCEGPRGRRTVKAEDWFQGLMATALRDDEILVEVRVPAFAAGTGGCYMKFPHPASRYAVVGVAAVVTLDRGGVCAKAVVAVTGPGTRAVRARGVEAGLLGKPLDAGSVEAAAEHAAEGVDVQADLQGSVEYKAHLCRVFARRAITEAARRAQAAR